MKINIKKVDKNPLFLRLVIYRAYVASMKSKIATRETKQNDYNKKDSL
jgi:hypothetical protein